MDAKGSGGFSPSAVAALEALRETIREGKGLPVYPARRPAWEAEARSASEALREQARQRKAELVAEGLHPKAAAYLAWDEVAARG